MEKLILTCGRFVPAVGGDEEARVRGLEAYLARMTEELELLLSELGRTLDQMNVGGVVADTASATATGEEG